MNDIIAIAQNTFGRHARQKALYVILIACVVVVWAMGLYGVLSIGRDQIMMIDAALAVSLIVGLVTAMSAGFEIPREMKDQTVQLMLSKPLGRSHFLVGKMLGISALCMFNIILVAAGSALVINMRYGQVPPALFSGAVLAACEAIVLTAAGILLSLCLGDLLAVVGVFLVFVIGHSIYMLPNVLTSGVGHRLAAGLARILPNFHHFDFKNLLGNGVAIGSHTVWFAGLYAVAYTVVLMALATAVFEKRDIA